MKPDSAHACGRETTAAGRIHASVSVMLMSAAAIWVASIAPGVAAEAKVVTEEQSFFTTADGTEMSSSRFFKLVNTKLDEAYQNLTVVITSCFGGEFAFRASAMLKGTWSVSTMSDKGRATSSGIHSAATNNGNPGLKSGNSYYYGPQAQYIRLLSIDGANATPKDLFNKMSAASVIRLMSGTLVESIPLYASSGQTADQFPIHGGTQSNHAIVAQEPTNAAPKDTIYSALTAAAYTDATIDLLRGTAVPAGKVDRTFTEDDLGKALTSLRTSLDAAPGKENAYIYVNAHGNIGNMALAYAPDSERTPGSGYVLSQNDPDVNMPISSAVALAGLQEELLRADGTGYWRDDPIVHSAGAAFLAFSTHSENFHGNAVPVSVRLNGRGVGSVTMGNNEGRDYQIAISDGDLAWIMDTIVNTGNLLLSFGFQSSADYFQLAVPEDIYGSALGYGITIGRSVDSMLAMPEPPTWSLVVAALLVAMSRHEHGRRRRTAPAPGHCATRGRCNDAGGGAAIVNAPWTRGFSADHLAIGFREELMSLAIFLSASTRSGSDAHLAKVAVTLSASAISPLLSVSSFFSSSVPAQVISR